MSRSQLIAPTRRSPCQAPSVNCPPAGLSMPRRGRKAPAGRARSVGASEVKASGCSASISSRSALYAGRSSATSVRMAASAAMALLQLAQLVGRVRVEERGVVVERHLDAAMLRRPLVDLALAALDEAH